MWYDTTAQCRHRTGLDLARALVQIGQKLDGPLACPNDVTFRSCLSNYLSPRLDSIINFSLVLFDEWFDDTVVDDHRSVSLHGQHAPGQKQALETKL